MSDISEWASSASDNNVSAPDGFPEGMSPASVNNACREVMAAVRRQHEDAQWINLGDTPNKVDSDTFTISGDVTADYEPGRKVRLGGSSTAYGTIASSSYSAPNTTVNLTSTVVPTTLSTVSLGILSSSNNVLPATYAFLARRNTTNQSLGSNTATTVLFNDEVLDAGSNYDPATGIWTAPADGIYLFTAKIDLQNNASSSVDLTAVSFIFTIGGFTMGGYTSAPINAASNAFRVSASIVIPLSAGNTAKVQVFLGTITGGAFTANVGSFFSGVRVG